MSNRSMPAPSPVKAAEGVKVEEAAAPRGVRVIASRDGWYKCQRIKEGVEFVIDSIEQSGQWMRCLDSELEKKRVEMLKQKKLKAGR